MPFKQTRGRFETLVKSVGTKALANGGEAVLIEGYASTPHIDRGDDITEPTAFTRTLELYMTNPVLLWDHGTDARYGYMPIGQVTSAVVESGGLRIKAEVTDPEVGGAIRRGELRTMSFGYEVPEGGFKFQNIDGRTVRVITELNLYEISVVAIPMNPHASFSLAKSLKAYFAQVDGTSKRTDAATIPSPQPNADRMDETTPEQSTAPETETPETTESAPEIETPEVTPETVVEVKAEETTTETPELETPVAEEEVKATETTEAPIVEESPATPIVDNAESSPAEATDAETAVQAEPSEQNTAPAPIEQENDTMVEVKSITSALDAETKTLNAKYLDLEAKHAALETKYSEAVQGIESLKDEYKTVDTAFAKLTDLVLRIKKVQDETPVNTPYAVSPGLAVKSDPAPKKAPHWSDGLTVDVNYVG